MNALKFALAAVVTALASTVFAPPPVARATDNDDVFWQTLDNYGSAEQAIDFWGSERKTIKAGKKACDLMSDGYAYNEVNMAYYQAYPEWRTGSAKGAVIGNTIFAGVTAYCRSYIY
jgi:hypothetical protein